MIDLKELARMGAVARLKALDDERIHLMAFLGQSTPKAVKATKTPSKKWTDAQRAKFRKTMSLKRKGRK